MVIIVLKKFIILLLYIMQYIYTYIPESICGIKELLLLLLLYNMDVSCQRHFVPGTSLEPAVIPTAHASSFTLQNFPYYV